MEISAVMNIHDFEAQSKKGQYKDPADSATSSEKQTQIAGHDEISAKPLSNEAIRQEDVQARTTRVEAQVDVQPAKETAREGQANSAKVPGSAGIGQRVDVIA